MSPTRLFLITIAALHLLQSVAFAFTWPKLNLPGKRFGRSKTVTEPQKTVRISQFTGGTGASAQLGLLSELTDARAFQITGSDAAYVISGSSVGGRVTGRVHDQTGKMIFERTYAAPGLDENLKALTDDLIFAITGKPGLATSRIIFVSDKSGTKQIYLCDSDGADVQQVTRHRNGAVSPSLAPDRTLAAFTTYRSGFPVVTVLDLGVGYERTVTDTPGSSFGAAFSPDGQHLALVMSFLGNPEIFVTDLGTNTAACISDTVGVAHSPAWHPDGKQVMFADDQGRGPELFLAEVPAEGGQPARLFRWRTGYRFSTDPEFSPNGSKVAFTARIGGKMAVVIRDFPSGATRVVQRDGAQHPSWSPNGRYLCYTHHGALYVHDLHTDQRRTILTGHGNISEPRWMR